MIAIEPSHFALEGAPSMLKRVVFRLLENNLQGMMDFVGNQRVASPLFSALKNPPNISPHALIDQYLKLYSEEVEEVIKPTLHLGRTVFSYRCLSWSIFAYHVHGLEGDSLEYFARAKSALWNRLGLIVPSHVFYLRISEEDAIEEFRKYHAHNQDPITESEINRLRFVVQGYGVMAEREKDRCSVIDCSSTDHRETPISIANEITSRIRTRFVL